MNPEILWPYATPTAREHYTRSVLLAGDDDCWIWTGGLKPDGGYGRYRPPGHPVIAAHRWSYLAHHGPTPWPVIRHHCDIRCCVNPHHLAAGTQATNNHDTTTRRNWRTHARTGPHAWPTLAYTLRALARTGDHPAIAAITNRPRQLHLST